MSRVLRATNHYEVLGVANRANVQEIKRAYRKLTVALHPDKNQTPGAEDAFQNAPKAKPHILVRAAVTKLQMVMNGFSVPVDQYEKALDDLVRPQQRWVSLRR